MEYYKELNDLFENRAILMINKSFDENIVKKNNLISNNIDLCINNSTYIDVQYSFNFEKYGDIRIDFLSAFLYKNDLSKEKAEKIIRDSKEKNVYKLMDELFIIKKYGKYISKEKCDGIIYFFYNDEKPLINNHPDIEKIKNKKISFLCFVPQSIIKKEIEENWLNLKYNFKINDKNKNNIKENHQSAFIFLNLDKLCKKYNLKKYTSKEEFYKNFKNDLNLLCDLKKNIVHKNKLKVK